MTLDLHNLDLIKESITRHKDELILVFKDILEYQSSNYEKGLATQSISVYSLKDKMTLNANIEARFSSISGKTTITFNCATPDVFTPTSLGDTYSHKGTDLLDTHFLTIIEDNDEAKMWRYSLYTVSKNEVDGMAEFLTENLLQYVKDKIAYREILVGDLDDSRERVEKSEDLTN